ncbi:MAG: hypothetical protein FRX49_02299 [Trebouxia sp. A1-2]|nr:MAG: hypothetical protein FRX49_02299 [Trebouxia sp. A1-2]
MHCSPRAGATLSAFLEGVWEGNTLPLTRVLPRRPNPDPLMPLTRGLGPSRVDPGGILGVPEGLGGGLAVSPRPSAMLPKSWPRYPCGPLAPPTTPPYWSSGPARTLAKPAPYLTTPPLATIAAPALPQWSLYTKQQPC